MNQDRLYVLAAEADDPPHVGDDFERGFRLAVIISVIFFWAPLIFGIAWLVNR